MKNYYEILGVQKGATENDIKNAYRKLAHRYHPDKKGGSESKFKEINEAYQVLGNSQKRAQYDKFGSSAPFGGAQGWPFGGAQAGQGNPFGGSAGFDWSGFTNAEGFDGGVYTDFGDFGDIFESFFEGIGVRPRRKTVNHGADIEILQEISLEDSFMGITKDLSVNTLIVCDKCKGRGGDSEHGMEQCKSCAGRGEVREDKKTFFGSFSQVRTCSTCRGGGEIPKKVCKTCKGEGRITGSRIVTLEILPGIRSDQIIQIKGFGESGEQGAPAGNLYVRVKIKPHKIFKRQGDDLIVSREMDIKDLIDKKFVEVPTIEGGKEKIKISAGFDLRQPIMLPGRGMPHFGSVGRGDLLVALALKMPKS